RYIRWTSSAVTGGPPCRSTVCLSEMSREICFTARTGSSSLTVGFSPSSRSESTRLVVPTFSAVAYSLILASPQMTCNRRKRRGVRLVPRVDERAIVKRIYAGLDRKEIGALRQLENSACPRRVVVLHVHFARACENLAGGEERQQGLNQAVGRHVAAHQVAFV